MEIHCKGGILEIRLQDSAPRVDPEQIKPKWVKGVEPGGLGICMIHDIMDEVEYCPSAWKDWSANTFSEVSKPGWFQ